MTITSYRDFNRHCCYQSGGWQTRLVRDKGGMTILVTQGAGFLRSHLCIRRVTLEAGLRQMRAYFRKELA